MAARVCQLHSQRPLDRPQSCNDTCVCKMDVLYKVRSKRLVGNWREFGKFASDMRKSPQQKSVQESPAPTCTCMRFGTSEMGPSTQSAGFAADLSRQQAAPPQLLRARLARVLH